MQHKQRGGTPAMQRFNQSISPVVQELYWIKDNSNSIKAKTQANKSITAFEKALDHAERAVTYQELKESQSSEQGVSGYNQRSKQRFQGQES